MLRSDFSALSIQNGQMDRRTENPSFYTQAYEDYAVVVGYVQVLFEYMRHRGYEPTLICSEERLKQLQTADSTTRVPINEWHQLMSGAESYLGDANLALTISEHCKPWFFGLFGFMAMTSSTLCDVSKVINKYHHLVNDIELVDAGIEGHRFFIAANQMTTLKSTRISMSTLGSWAFLARWLTGRSDLAFDVDFDFPQPGRPEPFYSLFKGQVRFNQPRSVLYGESSYLDLRVLQQDPMIHRILQEQAARQLAQAQNKGSGSFIAQLEQKIIANLANGEISLVSVAAEMHVSPRTLQNRIEEAGSSFRGILQRVRKYKAINYLNESQLSLSQIALTLGFTNQTSFQHAFKRWTGQSPGDFRNPSKDESK